MSNNNYSQYPNFGYEYPQQQPQPPKKKSHKAAWIVSGIGAVVFFGSVAGCVSAVDSAVQEAGKPTSSHSYNTADAPVAVEATETEAESTLTVSQENAVDKADSYLSFMAFSRSGLIEQLEYEQFSTADAEFAVDYINPDWDAQAVKKAASYMDTMSFSQASLEEQLAYEGFTPKQAAHGAASQF